MLLLGPFLFLWIAFSSAHAEMSEFEIPDPDTWVSPSGRQTGDCCRVAACADVNEKKLLSMRTLPTSPAKLGAKVERLFAEKIRQKKANFQFPIRFNRKSDFTRTRLFSAASVIDWDHPPIGVPDRIQLNGASRSPGFGEDGVLSILCHEVGHILGEGPRYKDKPTRVPEGEADDFAARECLPALFRTDPKTTAVAARAPEEVVALCIDKSLHPEEEAICRRVIMAGLQMGEQLHWGACLTEERQIRKERLPGLQSYQRDLSHARTLKEGYPSHQCRLEAYIAAARGEERASCWYPRPGHASKD